MSGFHLRSYLERIGVAGTPAPGWPALRAIHLAHLDRIPFENLDVRLGRPVRLDEESLQSKLVRKRRGGYCFEQNSLLASALRAIGFQVETLEARVRLPGATAPLPRTHMCLLVSAEGRRYLADVGFGGDGPLEPVALDGGSDEHGYRIDAEGERDRVLRRVIGGAHRDLYGFRLDPALAVDFEVAHHFTSTHPRSPFVQTLTVQRSLPDVRHVLRGRTYTILRDGVEERRELAPGEVPALIRGTFGLEVEDDEVIRALPEDA